MKTMMKVLALIFAMIMVVGCLAACGNDATTDNDKSKDDGKGTSDNTTVTTVPDDNNVTEPTDDDNNDPVVDDGKKDYTVKVTDSNGNPLEGVLVQICKEGSTCFKPISTNDKGEATWRLEESDDYYGTISSTEEGMPKVYFEDDFDVTLVIAYKIKVVDSEGNPVAGVLTQICKEGSTCFTPTRTNEQGEAVWNLPIASDYYGTVSSIEEGMPKEYFGGKFEVTLVYNPPVAE